MTRLREILIRSDRVDAARLAPLLAGIGVVARFAADGDPGDGRDDGRIDVSDAPILRFVEAGSGAEAGSHGGFASGGAAAVASGDRDSYADLRNGSCPPTGAIVLLPADPEGPLEPWIASTAARTARRVNDAEACLAPGVDGVLAEGTWSHPTAPDLPADGGSGVLVVKPGVRATPGFLASIAERAAECGYITVEARSFPAATVRADGLARVHYRSHCDFAARGRLTPHERSVLLRIYGTLEFEARYGCRARDLPVIAVDEFIASSGTPEAVIRAWSDASTAARGLDSGTIEGPNELGDDKYVNLFADPRWTPDGPVFLINPHMPSVLRWWEKSPSERVALLLAPLSDDALPWPRLRAEFCGISDGARARPGSIRRDAFEGVLDVPADPGETVDRTRNVVHLSNGPIEAIRETALWFGRPVESQPAGRALMESAGIDAAAILGRAYLEVDGVVRPFTSATAGLSVTEAAKRIARGRLLNADALACSMPTERRIDAAHDLLPTLLARGPISAVLLSGSAARNRASDDSDVDLIVIAPDSEHYTERMAAEGLLFECEWMGIGQARDTAAGGPRRDLKGLREASRIASAVTIHDPDDMAAGMRETAAAVFPAIDEIDARLTRALESLRDLAADPELPAFVQWEVVREIQDQLAVALLSLHPIRYQKPKWVIADLREIGRADLAAELLRSYGSDGDPNAATRTIAGVEEICAAIAAAHDLPTMEAVLAHGFVADYPAWSYACRTLADAKSLLADGAADAAGYTARFAARLALRLDGEESTAAAVTGDRAADDLSMSASPDPSAQSYPDEESPESAACEANPSSDAVQRGAGAIRRSHGERIALYRRLFGDEASVAGPADDELEICAAWCSAALAARKRVYGQLP